MASQWFTLVSQKLFLARQLADESEKTGAPVQREAALQGSIELALRGRRLLLVMIARLYQVREAEPDSIEQLAALVGDQAAELEELRALSTRTGSWWQHLDQLDTAQRRPPAQKKTVSAENIIAIATDTGPDRSVKTLTESLSAMKHFADTLEERHSEW